MSTLLIKHFGSKTREMAWGYQAFLLFHQLLAHEVTSAPRLALRGGWVRWDRVDQSASLGYVGKGLPELVRSYSLDLLVRSALSALAQLTSYNTVLVTCNNGPASPS